jgi:hypothetical protein
MTSNTARFLDVSTAEYHADPCAQPSLSASIARELIHKSPLHAWQVHPKLGNSSARRRVRDPTAR